MKLILGLLFKVVNTLFPKFYEKDLTNLNSFQKGIVGLKYWLTIRLLQ